jgi:hypothetical protein
MLDRSVFSLKRVKTIRKMAITESAERKRIDISRAGGRKNKEKRISNLISPAPTLNFTSAGEIKVKKIALSG